MRPEDGDGVRRGRGRRGRGNGEMLRLRSRRVLAKDPPRVRRQELVDVFVHRRDVHPRHRLLDADYDEIS